MAAFLVFTLYELNTDSEHLFINTLPDLESCLKGTGPLLRLHLQEQNFETSSLCTAEIWWGSPPQGSRLHYTLHEKEGKSSSHHCECNCDSFDCYSATWPELHVYHHLVLTYQLSCCHRWVAEQLLRPPVMWDFGQPAGSLRCPTLTADVLHTGRSRPLLQQPISLSSEQISAHTYQ